MSEQPDCPHCRDDGAPCPWCGFIVRDDDCKDDRKDDRVVDLEAALDDALAELARLRRWRERAWAWIREQGHDARELLAALDEDRPIGVSPPADEHAHVDPETARRVIAEAEAAQNDPVGNPGENR